MAASIQTRARSVLLPLIPYLGSPSLLGSLNWLRRPYGYKHTFYGRLKLLISCVYHPCQRFRKISTAIGNAPEAVYRPVFYGSVFMAQACQ
jgi:hypothetical protein